MASKNSRKIYVDGGYYHVYNRGVEKRNIFTDEQDHKVFLGYIKEYLTPPPDPKSLKTKFTVQDQVFKGVPRQPKNYHKRVELVAFCLMPNHFHLLVKQQDSKSVQQFMHSLLLRYSMYFNKKHDRVGRLYQGRYKAVLVTEDKYLLHLSRYIHLNPLKYSNDLVSAFSSYSDYLGLTKTPWIKPNLILNLFNTTTIPEITKTTTYRNFVESYEKNGGEILGKLALDYNL